MNYDHLLSLLRRSRDLLEQHEGAQTLVADINVALTEVTKVPRLTGRQRMLLGLAAEGLTVNSISKLLDRSPFTVSDAFKAIYKKLGASGRAEAITLAIRSGQIR